MPLRGKQKKYCSALCRQKGYLANKTQQLYRALEELRIMKAQVQDLKRGDPNGIAGLLYHITYIEAILVRFLTKNS